jgi:protein-disulfide isomerase
MDKRFWGFLVAVALVLAGIYFFTSTPTADAPKESAKGTLTNHVYGKNTTGVKLVEYGDFECPACGRYWAPLREVKELYKDKIEFQFRNFPLFQIHPNAIAAARAAEAADMQNKFWEMHDLLYENQQLWSQTKDPIPVFESYAKQLNLDSTKFKNDYKGRVANDRIQADIKEGTRLKVESTPTLFLNGKKLNPTPDATTAALSKVIDDEIAKQAKNKSD